MIVCNLPRSVRSFLRVLVAQGSLPLFLFGPKAVGSYAGRSGYFYGTEYQGQLVLVSINPVKTRDAGRGPQALHRFGRKASEYRVRNAA